MTGIAKVLDELVKRVVLLNRKTLNVIASQIVNADNSWEVFALDQGDGQHILLGFDEGGNFNIDAEDRASLGDHTFIADPVEFAPSLASNAEAFHVNVMQTMDFDNVIGYPMKLEGAANALSVDLFDTFYVLDGSLGEGHFENAANETILVGRDTDVIKENTWLFIGNFPFQVRTIVNNGAALNSVQVNAAIDNFKSDVLEDDSCVFNAPLIHSYLELTGNAVLIPNKICDNYIPGHIVKGCTISTNYSPPATVKSMTFIIHAQSGWDGGTSDLTLCEVPGVFSISVFRDRYTNQYLALKAPGWTYDTVNSVQCTATFRSYGVPYFCVFNFTPTGIEAYISDMVTPKGTTTTVYTFDGTSELFFGKNAHHTPGEARICNVQMFNKVLTQADREKINSDYKFFDTSKLQVTSCQNISFDEIARINTATQFEYQSAFKGFSPFYNTPLNTLNINHSIHLLHSTVSLLDIAKNIIAVVDVAELQNALLNCNAGDCIKCAPGTYSGKYILKRNVHIYGDTDDVENNPIIFTTDYQTITFDLDRANDDDPYHMYIKNIKFVMTYQFGDYGILAMHAVGKTRSLMCNLINCIFQSAACLISTQGVGEWSYISFNFYNCSVTNILNFYINANAYHRGVINFYKCYLVTDGKPLSNEWAPIGIQDIVYEETEGYGVNALIDTPINRVSKIIEKVIVFKIPAENDINDLIVGIDLSLYPEIFDVLTTINELAVLFIDGSLLAFEIEYWDIASKKGLIWVKLPYVSSTEDIYYALLCPYTKGLSGDWDSEIVHTIWRDYEFTYHMGYDPVGIGSCRDSSGNSYHGDPVNMASGDKTLSVLSSYEYSFDGTQKISLGKLYVEKLIEGNIDIVFKTSQAQGHILTQDADGNNAGDTLLTIGKPTGVSSIVPDGYLSFECRNGESLNQIQSLAALNDNTYHYVGLSWYRDNLKMVVDNAMNVQGSNYAMWGGNDVVLGNNLNGSIQEVLLSKQFKNAVFHELINESLADLLINYNELIGSIIDDHALVTLPVILDDSVNHHTIVVESVSIIPIEHLNFKGAFKFDGTNRVAIPHHTSLDTFTDVFTLDMWIKKTGVITNSGGLISKVNNDNFWGIYLFETGRISVGQHGVGGYNSALGLIVNDTWYHVAIVKKSTDSYFYVNGVQILTFSNGTLWTDNTNDLLIGGYTHGGITYNFNGEIAGIRLTKRILWDAEFTGSLPNTKPEKDSDTALLLNLETPITDSMKLSQLNVLAIPTVLDESDNAHTITIGNVGITTDAPQDFVHSFKFTGDSDSVSIKNHTTLNDQGGDRTIDLWFKRTGDHPNGYGGVLARSLNSSHWAIYTHTDGRICIGKRGVSHYASPTGAIVTGSEYHFALVKRGATTYFYVNGTQIRSFGNGTFWEDATEDIIIGGHEDATFRYYLHGEVTGVRFTNSALWDANFSGALPSKPTADSNTALLLTLTDVPFNNSFIFNNVNASLTVQENDFYDLSSAGSWTIEFDLKKDGAQVDWAAVLNNVNVSSPYEGWIIGFAPGNDKLRFARGSDGASLIETSVDVDDLSHKYAFVYDHIQNEVYLYIDDVLDVTTTNASPLIDTWAIAPAGTDLSIGAQAGYARVFKGTFKNFKISDVPRYGVNAVDPPTEEAGITFESSEAMNNLPVRIELSATSGGSTNLINLITPTFTNLGVLVNSQSSKIEVAYWESGVRAILWVLVSEVLQGTNEIKFEILEEANPLIGAIGTDAGRALWDDFDAVYHLTQDPAVGLVESSGNQTAPTPINMGAENLVDAYTTFDGIDESINLGALFPIIENAGQIHISFKTADTVCNLIDQDSGGSDDTLIFIDTNGKAVVNFDNAGTPIVHESLAAINNNTLQALSYSWDDIKRDFIVSSIDQIPFGAFGSDGDAEILIAAHHTGSTFIGQISELRLSKIVKTIKHMQMLSKVWDSSLSTKSNLIIAPCFSFDQKNTYNIWTGTIWRAIVSNVDTIHGNGGDTDYYFRDNNDIWSKVDIVTVNDAIDKAIVFSNNICTPAIIEALTSTEWEATNGMSSDGHFDCIFAFRSPIPALQSVINEIVADGYAQLCTLDFDLEPYHERIDTSEMQWIVKIMDIAYDYSQIKVYSCITGASWQECTRNAAIPGVTANMATTGLRIQFKAMAPLDLPKGSHLMLIPKIY